MRLPETDVHIFPIHIQWAYSGEIVTASAEEEAEDAETVIRAGRLTELYLMGDSLGDTLLRNAVTDRLRTLWIAAVRGPSAEATRLVYNGGAEGCKLQRLCLDWYLCSRNADTADWLGQHQAKLPKAFLADLAAVFMRANYDSDNVTDWEEASSRTYHDHDTDVPPCD